MIALKTNKNRAIFSLHGYLLLLLIIISVFACKSKKALQDSSFENDFFGIASIACEELVSPNTIDSKAGTLKCPQIELSYDYGLYGYSGPTTPEEEFRNAFDAYHHKKFFENRMIDPKVYKIFLDSVQVIIVRKKKAEDHLIIDCEPCNSTAEITFLGETYYYPVTLNEKQLDREGYEVRFEERGDFIYKFFKETKGNYGLFLSPKKNRFKKKNTLSVIVQSSSLDAVKTDQILASIYLLK